MKINLNKKSILLIDDDVLIHQMVVEQLKNYKVKSVQTELELDLVIKNKKYKFDIVILDYKLKNNNGLKLTNKIKNRFPYTKILLLTAYGSKELLIDALQHKLDGYMDKPIRKKILLNKINLLLGLIENDLNEKIDYIKVVEKIQSILNSENGYTFSLEKFAEQNKLSYKYISKTYSEITGENFRQSQKKIILEAAKNYLINTNISITNLSQKLGYKYPSAFMSFFKKESGISATEYKKKYKNQNNS